MKFIENGQFKMWFVNLMSLIGFSTNIYLYAVPDAYDWRLMFVGIITSAIAIGSLQAKICDLRPFWAYSQRQVRKSYETKEGWPKIIGPGEQRTKEDFIENLCLVDAFEATRAQAINQWGDGIAPLMLFASMGRQLGQSFQTLSASMRAYVFDLIEKAITEGDLQLQSMVKSGLLDAWLVIISSDPAAVKLIENELGEVSLAYVNSKQT